MADSGYLSNLSPGDILLFRSTRAIVAATSMYSTIFLRSRA